MTGVLVAFGFVAGLIVAALVLSASRRLGVKTAADRGPYQALVAQALARLTADDYAGAAAALRQAVELQSADDALYVLLGDALRRAGDLTRAERTVEVVCARADLAPEIRGAALLLRGRLHEETDRFDDALVAYEQAAAALPRAAAPLLALERLLSRRGRWLEAIGAAEKLAKLVPDRGRIVTARRRVLLAREQLADSKPKDALLQAETALREAPALAAARLTRGDALFQLGQLRPARDAWLEAAREAPHLTALVLDRLEGIGGSASDREQARRFAQDMIEREATGVSSWRLYAWIAEDALRRGDVGEARAWCQRVESAASRSATAARLRARIAVAEEGRAPGPRVGALIGQWQAERLWWDPWRCQRCGHALDDYEWRCPACQAWESFI